MCAPCATKPKPRLIVSVIDAEYLPSEKESGVTFKIPCMQGAGKLASIIHAYFLLETYALRH
jgi:hypothetical protein